MRTTQCINLSSAEKSSKNDEKAAKENHMKNRQKKKHTHFKTTTTPRSSQHKPIELEPEEALPYLRRAEREVVPLIQEMQLPPGMAFFLLAQYAHVFITGNPRLSVFSGTRITNTILALWQDEQYTPSSKYPYTLEETLNDVQDDQKTKRDYAEFFQPLVLTTQSVPCGSGEVSAGLVKHPETQLWQVWMILDGPVNYLGAYRDPTQAQHHLGAMIDAVRRSVSPDELERVSTEATSQSHGAIKQLPVAVIEYLLEHLDQYRIPL